MKLYLKNKIFVLIALLLIMSNILIAQSGPPNPPDPNKPVGGAPIDSGLFILFIVAIIYGVPYIKKYKNREQLIIKK